MDSHDVDQQYSYIQEAMKNRQQNKDNLYTASVLEQVILNWFNEQKQWVVEKINMTPKNDSVTFKVPIDATKMPKCFNTGGKLLFLVEDALETTLQTSVYISFTEGADYLVVKLA